ncbi:inverse autotransporter beta domain-containing protein [unidentified bacterial endosymbiont]|uniref:inverse autotransporter beta domain-containing protein n=1 Tax=unidentified bacterial endosymbiont TaxID=2355 RepID=UPI0020A2138B|nr:inverse autotransporter beta domain-containing protein [unidentified bacterial endosymbiont]
MTYLLHIALSGWLLITAPIIIAAGAVDHGLTSHDESSATVQASPDFYLAVGAPNEAVLIEGVWPLVQKPKQLLLLQGAWQRQQQRNLLSLGVGWRYFPKTHWGVGCNLFYDQETSRQQRRLGLGAETQWQSLTLAINGYLSANGWRTVRDLQEYQQRAANGYDVILRSYLPALPAIGASVRYAHYFGDAVLWGSARQRYQNPQQWCWGIDYTPIPLLTLAYYRQTDPDGQAKQQIRAVLRYHFSLPLSQQLDPQQVPRLHSARGQRLARVQREQLMALKYAVLSDNKVLRSEEKAKAKQVASRTEMPARAEPVASRTEEPARTEPVASNPEETAKAEPIAGRTQEAASNTEDPARAKKITKELDMFRIAEIRRIGIKWKNIAKSKSHGKEEMERGLSSDLNELKKNIELFKKSYHSSSNQE